MSLNSTKTSRTYRGVPHARLGLGHGVLALPFLELPHELLVADLRYKRQSK